jgi:Protein of unknown function (DUF1761)
MDVLVNYWAVILAAISAMVVGTVWYSPIMFQKTWEKMVSLDKEKGMKELPWVMGLTFIASLLMAYVLAHVSYLSNQFFGNSFMQDTLTTAFWLWLGINTPAILSGSLFEQRRKKAILLNVGNQLVTLMVMGLIIGLMGV